MDISMTLFNQLFFVWMFLAIPVTIYLARRKIEKPMATILWGLIAVFIPIISLVTLIVLSMKPDFEKHKVDLT